MLPVIDIPYAGKDDFARTMEDSHPEPNDRFVPVQREFRTDSRGDIMAKADGSYRVRLIENLSIQYVAGNFEMVTHYIYKCSGSLIEEDQ